MYYWADLQLVHYVVVDRQLALHHEPQVLLYLAHIVRTLHVSHARDKQHVCAACGHSTAKFTRTTTDAALLPARGTCEGHNDYLPQAGQQPLQPGIHVPHFCGQGPHRGVLHVPEEVLHTCGMAADCSGRAASQRPCFCVRCRQAWVQFFRRVAPISSGSLAPTSVGMFTNTFWLFCVPSCRSRASGCERGLPLAHTKQTA